MSRYQYHNAKPFVHEPNDYLAGFNRDEPFAGGGDDVLMTAPPAGKVAPTRSAPTHLQQYLHARGGELRPLLEIMANADAFVAEDDPDYPEALKNYEAFTDVSGDTNFPGTMMKIVAINGAPASHTWTRVRNLCVLRLFVSVCATPTSRI